MASAQRRERVLQSVSSNNSWCTTERVAQERRNAAGNAAMSEGVRVCKQEDNGKAWYEHGEANLAVYATSAGWTRR